MILFLWSFMTKSKTLLNSTLSNSDAADQPIQHEQMLKTLYELVMSDKITIILSLNKNGRPLVTKFGGLEMAETSVEPVVQHHIILRTHKSSC